MPTEPPVTTDHAALRLMLRGALRHFDAAQVRADFADGQQLALALMPPESFLRLAPPIPARINSDERSKRIETCLNAARVLSDLPELTLGEHEHEPGTWSVENHDGRHRALAMTDRLERIAVIIRVDPDYDDHPPTMESLRRIWSQYADEDDYPDPEDAEQSLYTPDDLRLVLIPGTDVPFLLEPS